MDIGVHEDGLIHFEMSKSFVNHPSQVVSVGDLVHGYQKADLEHENSQPLQNPRESN